MSWFELPDGSRTHLFGEGGGGRTAARYGVPLLAQIPLDGAVREGGDAGKPISMTGGPTAALFRGAASAVTDLLEPR